MIHFRNNIYFKWTFKKVYVQLPPLFSARFNFWDMYSSELSDKYNSTDFFPEEAFSIYLLLWQLYSVPGMVLSAGETEINKGHGPQSQAHGREVRTDL